MHNVDFEKYRKEIDTMRENKLKEQGVVTKHGVFGADMKIHQLSDGPVTIIYEIWLKKV